MFIGIKNNATGETKVVKCGFSWTLLFFSGFYGVPLFFRGVMYWAYIMLSTDLLCNLFYLLELGMLYWLFAFANLGLAIYLGFEGNEITIKQYLKQGWVFIYPEGEMTKYAKMRWGIFSENEANEAANV